MNAYRVYLHFTAGGYESHAVTADSFAEAVMAAEVLAGDRPVRSLEAALTLAPVNGAVA